jgi:ubiquinone/menaquinone biosynthesis C-methylase UbiE
MSERLRSLVEQLNLRPDDRALEIGCGHGVAGTFVCERLEEGHLTAIDRSAKMIQATKRRNVAYDEAGRAEFLVSALEELDLGDRRFDKIFTVRVGLFHRDPERARGIAEGWLTPGGELFVFFDQPSVPGTLQRSRLRFRRRSESEDSVGGNHE